MSEAGFYDAFASGDPASFTQTKKSNRRPQIMAAAPSATSAAELLNADFLQAAIYDPIPGRGLYRLFQHAVHLVTVERIELRTDPENFNFIFANYRDDNLCDCIYGHSPGVVLYLSNVILELSDRMAPMSSGAKAVSLPAPSTVITS